MVKYIIGILIILLVLRIIKASIKIIVTVAAVAGIVFLLKYLGILEAIWLWIKIRSI